MGLANLVPGVSGGTMLLASGIYPEFVEAVARVSTLRPSVRSLALLTATGGSAALAILLFAGQFKDLVLNQRWVMYSLFIGLTLGGAPLVWRLARPATRTFWIGAVSGLGAMIALAIAHSSSGSAPTSSGPLLLFVAGLAGASAMIGK